MITRMLPNRRTRRALKRQLAGCLALAMAAHAVAPAVLAETSEPAEQVLLPARLVSLDSTQTEAISLAFAAILCGPSYSVEHEGLATEQRCEALVPAMVHLLKILYALDLLRRETPDNMALAELQGSGVDLGMLRDHEAMVAFVWPLVLFMLAYMQTHGTSPSALTEGLSADEGFRAATDEERAAMLERLGIRRLAYDWRAEHVPTERVPTELLPFPPAR